CTMPAHALLPHPAEIRIRIEAATLAELFGEAARALAEIMGIAAAGPLGPWEDVVLDARDREALLVAWLDELIAPTEIDDLLYADVVIDELSENHLRARIRGRPIAAPRTAVKAATFYRLRIDEDRGMVLATVTVDV